MALICKFKCDSFKKSSKFTKEKTKRCKICSYRMITPAIHCACCGARMTSRIIGRTRKDVTRIAP